MFHKNVCSLNFILFFKFIKNKIFVKRMTLFMNLYITSGPVARVRKGLLTK